MVKTRKWQKIKFKNVNAIYDEIKILNSNLKCKNLNIVEMLKIPIMTNILTHA